MNNNIELIIGISIRIIWEQKEPKIEIRFLQENQKNVSVIKNTRNNHKIKTRKTIYLDIGSKHVIYPLFKTIIFY